MWIRIEKQKGSKEFGVKNMAGNVSKLVAVLKELNDQVVALGSTMEDLNVVILVGDDPELMEVE